MFRFLRSYATHLVALVVGSTMSAGLMVYGLLSVQVNGKVWTGFVACVVFTVLAAYRAVREEAGKRGDLERRQIEERREYLSSLNAQRAEIDDLEKRLTSALETPNFTGPFVVLEFIDVPGITNFVYHNIGEQDAY